MREYIFPLLRLGLDNSLAEDENLSDYIMLPAKTWESLGNIARAQGVLGIMLDGVDKLEGNCSVNPVIVV